MQSCLPDDPRTIAPTLRQLHTQNAVVTEIQNLLSEDEAQYLIREATAVGMTRSTGGLNRVVSADRTSSTAHLGKGSTPVVQCLEKRIATIAGMPPTHLEPLQVTQYKHSQQYKPHYDYFGTPRDRGGERTTTIFAYLHSDQLDAGKCGGATAFPKLKDDQGNMLQVFPKVGNAVMWSNRNFDGSVNEYTLHGGEQVTCKGAHKIGLNAWFGDAAWSS